MTQEGDDKKGFEHDGEFYEWHASDGMKDMLLLDRISNMSPVEFFSILDGEDVEIDQVLRAPVLYSLAAMSIRHARPEYSISRVVEICSSLDYSDLVNALTKTFASQGDERDDADPPNDDADGKPTDADVSESNGGESKRPSSRSKASPAGRSAKS